MWIKRCVLLIGVGGDLIVLVLVVGVGDDCLRALSIRTFILHFKLEMYAHDKTLYRMNDFQFDSGNIFLLSVSSMSVVYLVAQ